MASLKQQTGRVSVLKPYCLSTAIVDHIQVTLQHMELSFSRSPTCTSSCNSIKVETRSHQSARWQKKISQIRSFNFVEIVGRDRRHHSSLIMRWMRSANGASSSMLKPEVFSKVLVSSLRQRQQRQQLQEEEIDGHNVAIVIHTNEPTLLCQEVDAVDNLMR